ncbi:MAG TPA: Smr/MutS family protein [Longimicrobium sp.]|nr:Smr/MutS family protein [Longimicrobium sp.]
MALAASGGMVARRRRPRDASEPRGTVHPLLDLHGLTGGEARVRAELWLRDQAIAGERTVVVVTGRGNRSQGLPVLRGEVEDVLARLQGDIVTGWGHTDGGGGFRIGLRPPPPSIHRPTRAPSTAGALLRDTPPELRRRAEEALHELGISPTPELLRAEIRRLLAEDGSPSPER